MLDDSIVQKAKQSASFDCGLGLDQDHAKRLFAYIDMLREDRRRLLEVIERETEQKRPVLPRLPREVAEALEKAKKDPGGLDLLAWRIAQSPNQDDFEYEHKHMKVLRSYADRESFLDLIDALRYGYTIEESKEFTTNRKLTEYEIRAIRNYYKGAIARMADGTDEDGFAKEAIEEVALYLGGAELLEDIRGG